ncbi:MAG: beta-propeller fold lactonase family protein [Planctomycetes bacterium]|nr:beta-propeller fold lactonase family protein [Planctomycetota bacterium]
MTIDPKKQSRMQLAAMLLTLTASALGTMDTAEAQSVRPAVFVAHNIATNPNFNNYAAVTSFTVNSDGTVEWVGNYFTNDNPQAIALSPNGKWLAVTHGTSNSVTEDLLVFRVESDASLTMRAVYSTPDSPLDVEWINDETVACTETDLSGDNFVHVYRFSDTNPILRALP